MPTYKALPTGPLSGTRPTGGLYLISPISNDLIQSLRQIRWLVMFHKLIRNGDGPGKTDVASNNPSFVPLPTTIVNLVPESSTPGTEKPSAIDTRPAVERSGGWASNLFRPSRSKPQNSSLKLGPSGAVVFQPCESQESVISTLRPRKSVLASHFQYMAADDSQHLPSCLIT